MAITIRLAKKGDAKKIIEMRNEGHRNKFNKYTGTNRLLTVKDARRYDKGYAEKKKGHIVMLAIGYQNGKIVGVASFEVNERGRTRHRGESGWSVNPTMLGKA